MTVWAAALVGAEVVGVATLPALILIGLGGIAGVVAIGSAVIVLGARRPAEQFDEEVTTEPAP